MFAGCYIPGKERRAPMRLCQEGLGTWEVKSGELEAHEERLKVRVVRP